jgi:hypothetical protein
VLGHPVFSFLSWFLFALYGVEVIHAALARVVRRSWATVLSVVGLLALGQWVASLPSSGLFDPTRNLWYSEEVLVAAAFYQIGVMAARHGFPMRLGTRARITLALASWVFVAATFSLNSVVMMSAQRHGDVLWFPLTAFAGSMGLVLAASLTEGNRSFAWIGRRGIVYLGRWRSPPHSRRHLIGQSLSCWGGLATAGRCCPLSDAADPARDAVLFSDVSREAGPGCDHDNAYRARMPRRSGEAA